MNYINKNSVDVNDFVEESYLDYGKEVNLRRSLPCIYDGLKPVYRKLIISAMEYPKGKWVDTVSLIGTCKGKYYLHGDASLEDVTGRLVQSGIFDGYGAFGKATLTCNLPNAAARYTRVKISDKYRSIFDKLMSYVPTFNNDLGIPEPEYIASPIPLGILLGMFGFGIGLITRIPPLEPKSVVQAMKADDPQKLVFPGFNVSAQEKLDFWTKSNFSITYKWKWTRDQEGYHIFGSGDWIKPNYPPMYSKEDTAQEYPKYQLIDNFGDGRTDVTIIPYSKDIDDKAIDKCCTVKQGMLIWVSDPFTNKVRRVNGRNFLKICYDNYLKLYQTYKIDTLKKLRIRLEAYVHFKDIANRILNTDNSKEKIYQDLKLSCIDVVDFVSGMPVGTLRNCDPVAKIKSIKDEIKVVENYDVNSILDTL